MKRSELVRELDTLLHVAEIEDDSQNGLQVEGAEDVTLVALAVDASLAAFQQAAAAGAQLLIVHHGLFWGKVLRLTGPHYRRVKTLLDAGVGLYAVHLPLDFHPELGNNAELARLLGLEDRRPFGNYHGSSVGIGGRLPQPLPLADLVERLAQASGAPPVHVQGHGPNLALNVGCVSGGAAFLIDQAQAAGFDTYITGETSHGAFHEAAERGLNVIFGGHYATETLGVKALGRYLEERFGLATVFIDLPTGW